MTSLRSLTRASTLPFTSFRFSPLAYLYRPHSTSSAAPQCPPDASQPSNPLPKSSSLNINTHKQNPSFYAAISHILTLRQKYIRDRALFIEGKTLAPLLLQLGANPTDLQTLPHINNTNTSDPTLPFRKSRNARFSLNTTTRTATRLEHQPFTLSTTEDFIRHDSDTIRHFDEVAPALQTNSIFQALLLFKTLMIHGVHTTPRPGLNYTSHAGHWVCTLFALRTVTTPSLLGEPALEGVHADGVDHTMTTFLKADNMARGSAATFLHEMDEETGIELGRISPGYVRGWAAHAAFLDTLLLVDHEVKHSLSAVRAVDAGKEAYRDMLIFFTRRPALGAHVSGAIDSLRPHRTMPMEVQLFVP
ncbi:2OG-Fe dioxygenase family protein [Aspergillus mulundensis]|uniref:Uncharacterized protein n=1 Tax=Aspergillus mulundensis TaxID=1810919 RepID=A0A3D8T4P5_9EURO|nr:Uncharacterized protein DSM5745_00290 [Aspergillus mulundensis]RDW92968.1 Uncharacterized protein DSM5745_00290 [Aspergillus mulundensis]